MHNPLPVFHLCQCRLPSNLLKLFFQPLLQSQCSSGFALSHPAFFPYVLSPDRFAIQFHSVNSYYMLCPQPFLKSLTLFPVPEIHTHKRNNLLNMPIGYISEAPQPQHCQNRKHILSPTKPVPLAGLPQSTALNCPSQEQRDLLPLPPNPITHRSLQSLNPDSLRTGLS